MDGFDDNEFSSLTFDSDFNNFLGGILPASRNAGTTLEQRSASSSVATRSSSQQNGRQSSIGVVGSQCQGCTRYKEEIDRLSKEHSLNFMILKKKVISTDLLIRRSKAKQDECELLQKNVENLNKELDRTTRDSNLLSEQLQSAMQNIKPLKEEKERLERELKEKTSEVRLLHDKLEAEEAIRSQRSALDEHNKTLEITITNLKRQNASLTTKTRSMESQLKDLKRESKALTSNKNVLDKRLSNFANALKKAQLVFNSYWGRFVSAGLTAKKKPKIIPDCYKSVMKSYLSIELQREDTSSDENYDSYDENVAENGENLDENKDHENGYSSDSEDFMSEGEITTTADFVKSPQSCNNAGRSSPYRSPIEPQRAVGHQRNLDTDSKHLACGKLPRNKSLIKSIEFDKESVENRTSALDKTCLQSFNKTALVKTSKNCSPNKHESVSHHRSKSIQQNNTPSKLKPQPKPTVNPRFSKKQLTSEDEEDLQPNFKPSNQRDAPSQQTAQSKTSATVGDSKKHSSEDEEDSSLSSLSPSSSSSSDEDSDSSINSLSKCSGFNQKKAAKSQIPSLEEIFLFASIQKLLSPLPPTPSPPHCIEDLTTPDCDNLMDDMADNEDLSPRERTVKFYLHSDSEADDRPSTPVKSTLQCSETVPAVSSASGVIHSDSSVLGLEDSNIGMSCDESADISLLRQFFNSVTSDESMTLNASVDCKTCENTFPITPIDCGTSCENVISSNNTPLVPATSKNAASPISTPAYTTSLSEFITSPGFTPVDSATDLGDISDVVPESDTHIPPDSSLTEDLLQEVPDVFSRLAALSANNVCEYGDAGDFLPVGIKILQTSDHVDNPTTDINHTPSPKQHLYADPMSFPGNHGDKGDNCTIATVLGDNSGILVSYADNIVEPVLHSNLCTESASIIGDMPNEPSFSLNSVDEPSVNLCTVNSDNDIMQKQNVATTAEGDKSTITTDAVPPLLSRIRTRSQNSESSTFLALETVPRSRTRTRSHNSESVTPLVAHSPSKTRSQPCDQVTPSKKTETAVLVSPPLSTTGTRGKRRESFSASEVPLQTPPRQRGKRRESLSPSTSEVPLQTPPRQRGRRRESLSPSTSGVPLQTPPRQRGRRRESLSPSTSEVPLQTPPRPKTRSQTRRSSLSEEKQGIESISVPQTPRGKKKLSMSDRDVSNTVPSSLPTVPSSPLAAPSSPAVKTLQSSPAVPFTQPALTAVQTSPPALIAVQTSPPALTAVQTCPPALTAVQTSPPALRAVQTSPPALTAVPSCPPAVPASSPTLTAVLSSSSVLLASPAVPVSPLSSPPAPTAASSSLTDYIQDIMGDMSDLSSDESDDEQLPSKTPNTEGANPASTHQKPPLPSNTDGANPASTHQKPPLPPNTEGANPVSTHQKPPLPPNTEGANPASTHQKPPLPPNTEGANPVSTHQKPANQIFDKSPKASDKGDSLDHDDITCKVKTPRGRPGKKNSAQKASVSASKNISAVKPFLSEDESKASTLPQNTELPESKASTLPQNTELPQSKASTLPQNTELPQSKASTLPLNTELPQSKASTLPLNTDLPLKKRTQMEYAALKISQMLSRAKANKRTQDAAKLVRKENTTKKTPTTKKASTSKKTSVSKSRSGKVKLSEEFLSSDSDCEPSLNQEGMEAGNSSTSRYKGKSGAARNKGREKSQPKTAPCHIVAKKVEEAEKSDDVNTSDLDTSSLSFDSDEEPGKVLTRNKRALPAKLRNHKTYESHNRHTKRSVLYKAASGNMMSDNTASGNTSTDNAASDNTASENVSNNKTSGSVMTDSEASDKTASDNVSNNKASGSVMTDNTASGSVMTDSEAAGSDDTDDEVSVNVVTNNEVSSNTASDATASNSLSDNTVSNKVVVNNASDTTLPDSLAPSRPANADSTVVPRFPSAFIMSPDSAFKAVKGPKALALAHPPQHLVTRVAPGPDTTLTQTKPVSLLPPAHQSSQPAKEASHLLQPSAACVNTDISHADDEQPPPAKFQAIKNSKAAKCISFVSSEPRRSSVPSLAQLDSQSKFDTSNFQPINPPATSFLNHSVTTSSNPPVTLSNPPVTLCNPPVTLCNPPVTTLSNPPVTSLTNSILVPLIIPRVTSSTNPPVVSLANPPVTSSASPPVMSLTNPPVVSLTNPPLVSLTNPPVVSLTNPPLVSLTNPPVVSLTNTPVTLTNPPVVSLTNPPLVSLTNPPVVSLTNPPVVSLTNPPVVSLTNPPVVSLTNPPVVSLTNPPVVSLTNPLVVSLTNPPVILTNPPVVSLTNPPVVSLTNTPVIPLTNPQVSSLMNQPATKPTQSHNPVVKKRKLIVSASSSPSPRNSNETLLSEIFHFFKIPRLLSPLPPSPVFVECPDGAPVNFGSSTSSADIIKVHPLGKPSKTSKSLSHHMAEARVLLAKKSAISNNKIQAALDRKRKAEIVSQSSPSTCGATVQQSRIQAQPSTKRQKLANLSSFPSPSDAIYHDLQVFLDTDQVDVKLTIENMLSRVDGSDSKAMWKVLPHAVVRYLSTKQENVLEELFAACQKKGIIKTIFISQAESKLLDFLSEFIKLYQDTDKSGLMGVVWTAIFNKELTSQAAKQSLCRLFTSLCKTQGDIEQVRVLLYNIAWCGYLDTPILLLAIVGVWPDVMSTTAQHKKSSVIFVFEYLLGVVYKDDNETYQKVSHVLQRICHWDIQKKKYTPEELLKFLHKQLNELLKSSSKRKDDLSFELMKAMELLLSYQGAAWTEEHFFKRLLVSVASKWLHRGGEDNGPTPQLVICLFRLFRSVVAIHPLTTNGLGVVLSQVFAKFITRNSALMNVETSYIDTLLEITPQNPERCLELLKKWKDNNKGKMLNQTFSKLLQIQTLLSKQGTT